jgi:hypothetical protein
MQREINTWVQHCKAGPHAHCHPAAPYAPRARTGPTMTTNSSIRWLMRQSVVMRASRGGTRHGDVMPRRIVAWTIGMTRTDWNCPRWSSRARQCQTWLHSRFGSSYTPNLHYRGNKSCTASTHQALHTSRDGCWRTGSVSQHRIEYFPTMFQILL